MKIPVIIQARAGSKRFPKKVLAELAGRTVMEYVIQRCRLANNIGIILLATTYRPEDNEVAGIAESLGVSVYRGSDIDVLLRYVEATNLLNSSEIIRITADCPLIDPKIIDQVINMYYRSPADYVFIENYPDGIGAAELITTSALKKILQETKPEDTYYREHVMTYIMDNPGEFILNIEQAPMQYRNPQIHLSVDDVIDLEIVKKICEVFLPRIDFDTEEILTFLDNNIELRDLSRRRVYS